MLKSLHACMITLAWHSVSADSVATDGDIWRSHRGRIRDVAWAGDWDWFDEAPPLGPLDLVCMGGVVTLAFFFAGEFGKRPTAHEVATRSDLESELNVYSILDTAKDIFPDRDGFEITSEIRPFMPPMQRRHEPSGFSRAGYAESITNDMTAIMKIAVSRPEACRRLFLDHGYTDKMAEKALKKFEDLGKESARLSDMTHVGSAFARADVNGDGMISKDELTRTLRNLDAALFTDERIHALFTVMDKNSDSRISYTEFVEFIFAAGTDSRASAVDQVTRDVAHKAIEGIAGGALEDGGVCWRREHGSGALVLKVEKSKRREALPAADSIDQFFDFLKQMKEEGLYDEKDEIIIGDPESADDKSKTRSIKLRDFFNSLDANKNGKITISEFEAGVHSLGLGCEEAVLAQIFSEIDKERTVRKKIAVGGGDAKDWSKMTREEREEHKRQYGKPLTHQRSMKDGLLTFGEFKEAFKKYR